MGVKVYGMDVSAPVRMVMMTCEVVGVEYELIVVNLMTGENMKPEYLKVRRSKVFSNDNLDNVKMRLRPSTIVHQL